MPFPFQICLAHFLAWSIDSLVHRQFIIEAQVVLLSRRGTLGLSIDDSLSITPLVLPERCL